ncbi:MAG: nucleotidyltransferase family protein [Clostridiales bacterium]|nr:nucleotidyltransferase family protein [Clostridiales bacterium]
MMRTAGIIAEYNPFHNGHLYHIEETRRRTEADYIIAVISGDFVQRGGPALLNKYVRAEMALRCGADLVIELPVTAALSSAESFARGGVCLLDRLHVVDVISCGCENASEDPELFRDIVRLLSDEPEGYRHLLRAHAKTGLAFPQARELAVTEYLRTDHSDVPDLLDTTDKNHVPTPQLPGTDASEEVTDAARFRNLPGGSGSGRSPVPCTAAFTAQDNLEERVPHLLSSPNNILAVEYAKAIRTLSSSMDLCLIPRKGSAYHSEQLSENLSSATAIRQFLQNAENDPAAEYSRQSDTLRRNVPPAVYDTLQQAAIDGQYLLEDDFSDLLFYALTQRQTHLADYCRGNNDLAYRIKNSLEAYTDWHGFASLLKSKNRTHTAISRCLTHILLNLTGEDFAVSDSCGHAPYARVLGFRRDAAPMLKEVRKRADLPIITRPAKDFPDLTEEQKNLFSKNAQASEIYRYVLCRKSGQRLKTEFRRPLVLL